MFKWPVVPLCEWQLRDVNPNDIIADGLYRKCNTYKGVGGYDKFPAIFMKRYGLTTELNNQFVVQLRGCTLNCPYCYVAQDGVEGVAHLLETNNVLDDFYKSGCRVFHLMGGAPALYIDNWIDILCHLKSYYIFHSDLLLVEKQYTKNVVDELAEHKNSLYAVSIKGGTQEEFYQNTKTKLNEDLFWDNLSTLINSELQYYFTFTGMPEESVESFKQKVDEVFNKPEIFEDSFRIELVHYKALD